MRGNKKLSNLGVYFGVKAVINFCVKSKDSVVLGLSGQIRPGLQGWQKF